MNAAAAKVADIGLGRKVQEGETVASELIGISAMLISQAYSSHIFTLNPLQYPLILTLPVLKAIAATSLRLHWAIMKDGVLPTRL